MYEFHKNNKGEYTEGFLGEPENFNGIVFLLREPNTGGEPAEEFWLKEVLTNPENYHKALESSNTDKKKIANSKRDATKFRKRFSEMLEFIDHKEDDLKNSVFCNVNPKSGGKTLSKEYKEAMKNGKPQEMALYFASLKDEITVFTCVDIYKKLFESDNTKIDIIEQKKGFIYNRKPLDCFIGKIDNKKITVYAIYHPSSREGEILGIGD